MTAKLNISRRGVIVSRKASARIKGTPAEKDFLDLAQQGATISLFTLLINLFMDAFDLAAALSVDVSLENLQERQPVRYDILQDRRTSSHTIKLYSGIVLLLRLKQRAHDRFRNFF